MSRLDSRTGLLEREQEVIKMLDLFLDKKLNFIVVGGYAVSTYKKRFSIDLDIAIKQEDLNEFEKILEKEGYILSYEKEIALLYGENFKRFMKKINKLPVSIDLMINGLASRKTKATWGIEYIKKNSVKRKLNNSEFLTPERELLVAMKLHSGRLSDIRDIVALMPCNKEKLKKHLLIGDIRELEELIKKQADFLGRKQFDDSFKGIFGPFSYNEKDADEARKEIKEILDELENES